MKTTFLLLISTISILNSEACQSSIKEETIAQNGMEKSKETQQIIITVNSIPFKATLMDSPTAEAFKALLPLTINMNELNRNEKYVDLPESLPINASNPKMIHNGDLMLYGSSTLVLFYKTFSTSYNYTKIGKLDKPEELQKALGLGNVPVNFEINQ